MISVRNGIEYEFIKAKEESDYNLIFIHGSGFNKFFFSPVARKLSKYNCYLIDLPGHGGSLDSGCSFENYINAVSDFIREVDNAVVIGHSIGSTIALAAALRRIHKIKAVMIIGGGAESAAYSEEILNNVKKGLVDMNSFKNNIGHSNNAEVIEVFKHVESERIVLNDLKIGMSVNILNSLQNIDIPLSILSGDRDKLYPVVYAEHIHEKIEHSKLVIYKDIGSMLPLVKIDEVVSEINKLINVI